MAKIAEVYGSGSVLNAADLVGKGDIPVTIESTKLVKFDDGNKILASFRGKEKGLAINFTNANTLAEISGSDDSDDWEGLRIVLYVTKVPFGAKMVDSIRIKAHPQAAPPKPLATPLDDKDIPFLTLMPSVRDLIGDIQRDLRREDITPTQMAGHLARLSSLYGNVLAEEREAELFYKHALLKCFELEGKGNRATILAETTPEYQRFREAHDLGKLTLEMMRSMKQAMRSIADEMRAMS